MKDYVVGVDVGGTNIRAGAMDSDGNILCRKRTITEADRGIEQFIGKLEGLVREIRKELPEFRLKAAGFGIPGAIRSREGVVTQAPNFPALDGQPVRGMLEGRLQIPCFIENDANAIALGEMWVGAGRGFSHIVSLTLGTGVGGGIIIEGELLRGADGMAAELGHLTVKSDGARCNCGSFGCLETFASATGILRMYSERTLTEPQLSKADGRLTTAKIYDMAKSGDAVSREVLEAAGIGLGVGLSTLVNVFNPEIIIIGGGVAAAWDLLLQPAVQTMNARAFKAPAARVKVVRAEKEDDAGIYGAGYVAWDLLQRGEPSLSRERRLTPWGFWQVLEEGKGYKVKRLYIHPGHRLSYQKHQHREETWMIAAGEATVMIDDEERILKAGETIHIGKTQAHRIGNNGDIPVIFFEVQRGTYFGEDDIVRLQDDYKRT